MNTFITFCIFLLLTYCTISWILPKLLAWLFQRKYNIILKIGRIGIPYLRLCDVLILKNGISVHVDEISFRSSFLNSEVTKLVTLVVRDVRVNKDIGDKKILKKNGSFTMDFRNKKIPPFITTFAQFMAIHVYNISAMFLRADTCLIHATAAELHMDGSVLQNARTLLVNTNLSEARVKVLRHADNKNEDETCLGELSFAISMEATLVAQGPLSVEKLHLGMSQTSAVINEGFYSFVQERRLKNKSDNVSSNKMPNIYRRIAPIIPKNFTFNVESTSLRSLKNNTRTDFVSTIQNFIVNIRFNAQTTLNIDGYENLPQVFLAFQISNFNIRSSKEVFLVLNTLTLDAKVENNIVNLLLKLNTLSICYNHVLIHNWITSNFLQNKCMKTTQIEQDLNQKCENGFLEKIISQCIINGCAELWHISVLLRLSEQEETNASIGFDHTKLILNQAFETRGFAYNSYIPKVLLGNRHWTVELLVEALWCHLSIHEPDTSILKKQHPWGTPLFLGVALVKVGSHGSRDTKMDSMLDSLQAEWSPNLAKFILLALVCLNEYHIPKSTSIKTTPKLTKSESYKFHIHINLTNFNCFFITTNNVYIVARLNSTTVDKTTHKTYMKISDFKLTSLEPNKSYYTCVRAEEIKTFCCYINLARLDGKRSSNINELKIQCQNEVFFNWSTNLHLKVLTLLNEIKEFRESVSELIKIPSKIKEEGKPKKDVTVELFGNVALFIKISENHNMNVTVDRIVIQSTNETFSIENITTLISIDNANIFTIEGLKLNRIHDNKEVKEERYTCEDFVLPWNKTWGFNVNLLRASFPYVHCYAEAIQNEFISVFKWLKIVHKKTKVPFTVDSPLPSDLLINIGEFLFEMSDDPFEVKLRDNYELLEDEYKESLKRQKMLDAKVAELCKTHLHLPAGKVEELYANLSKKNAEIYIQRSKQMYRAVPPRTRLFAWCMSSVKILALADPSIHGAERVIKVMKEIDTDSPWPEEGLEFTTLWCRSVSMSCKEWKFLLRDFPQPLLDISGLSLFGRLIGAEEEAPRRARRGVSIDLGEPWGFVTIERGMTPLKFYHDFNCEVQHYSYAFGPCWEPVIAQCNLSFEKISAPSRDPSPPLSFWDKMRLLFHGRLTMCINQLTVLLHASLDPYNTTEEMELTWSNVAMDWTNAKFVYKGDLNVYVRTASKYDDCRLLHLPNLKLTIKIDWVCLADPNDHHSVIPCAPDKLPEYSSNQEHDSFRAFRSQNINISIALETKSISNQSPNEFECPTLLLYGSTLRWIENLKLILSGVTRPTRRGTIFKNVRPRKIQLSRHYRKVHLLLGLHRFQICYWMSFAMQRGFELLGGRLSSSSEHTLTLVPIEDGLKHRPRAEWSIMYMNCDLTDAEVWLQSALEENAEKEIMSMRHPVEKCYCLSVGKVSYGRETVLFEHAGTDRNAGGSKDTPTHRLVVYDLKGAWTKSNRNVAFALFDTFMKTKQLKKNLSTEALKGFRCETNSTPLKSRRNVDPSTTPPNPAALQVAQTAAAHQNTPSPMSKLQSSHAATMLQQLIAEAENKNVVFSDDLSSATRQQHLKGLQACQEDDVQHKNWLIALVNSQVLLKGCETKGYVILSAAKAEILQRVHRPVWKDHTLVSKTTWVGSLECLQYYATVSAGESDSLDENIMWLTVDNIQQKDSTIIADLPDVPDLVGSGQSVGGVVSETVGASSIGENPPIQLQRIVSRCKCEFFYVDYGDSSIDPGTVGEVPPPPQEDVGPWDRPETAVDAFTLMHHDLDVCTNSLQYAMLLDIVNNLLLYVEPHRKKVLERLARMRFQLQLHSIEDQKRPIQNLQNQVRGLVSKIRRLEKEWYLLNKTLAEEPTNVELFHEMEHLESVVYECKEHLTNQSEELDIMLSCYKEKQLLANSRLATTRNDKPVTTVRANEICFKHAQWRLTEADGQLGIADLVLSNFLYTKNSRSDDSVEHLLELGYIRMTNLLPNQVYTEVLCPTEIQTNMPIDHKRVLRVFCRERPPVGGISVKEHFEINVVPITIGLTKKFFNTMLRFCFPERDPDNIEGDTGEEIDENARGKRTRSSMKKHSKDTNFYVQIDPKDDVEKMKERAEKNKLFIYIKIPEVPVRVSYKGNKEKNIEDIRDFSLVIPTLEYHNVTWTWLDLLLAMKSDSRRVILSQAIKQKLQLNRNRGSSDESTQPQEEDKARMLFGARHLPNEKGIKRGVSGVFKFHK